MPDVDLESNARPPSLVRRIVAFPLVLMVIAIVVFIAAAALAQGLLSLTPPAGDSPLGLAKAALFVACLVLGYWLFCRFVERAPMRDFGREGWAAELLAGLAGGALIFGLIVAVAAALGLYHVDGWGNPATIWAALAGMALVPGVSEELLFRGILFRFIERTAGSWAALAVTSALFGLAHIANPNSSALAAAAIAIEAGLLLGAVYMLTRRLWAAIGLHAAWNFTQGWLFGLPVSGTGASSGMVEGRLAGPELLTGGAFGLEASLVAVVVATSAGAAILWVAARKGRFVAPMWVRKRGEEPAAIEA